MDRTAKANGTVGKSRPKSAGALSTASGGSTSGLPSIVVDHGDWQPPTTIARCDSCILPVEPSWSSPEAEEAAVKRKSTGSVNVAPTTEAAGIALLRAARDGQTDRVVEFLDSGVDIGARNTNGLTALHLAAKDGRIDVMAVLLSRGADVHAATKRGNTALHVASLAGQLEAVRILLEKGASVNVLAQNGFTALYMASQENHADVVRHLLSHGADQDIATDDGFTPAAVALQQRHEQIVSVLASAARAQQLAAAAASSSTVSGATSGGASTVRLPPLHVAAKRDDVETVTSLIRSSNDRRSFVNETTRTGFTALHISSHYGHINSGQLLIEHGADVNKASFKNQIVPLHIASKWGRDLMVKLLLDNGADINSRTKDDLTALHCAARSGQETVVDLLLSRGASATAKTRNGLTALHTAVQGDNVQCVRLLLLNGAHIDAGTADQLTALHIAAHCGSVQSTKVLLENKCDVEARALNGYTALHIACKKNRIPIIELLLKDGASINASTEKGLTPLHVTAFVGLPDVANEFIHRGADINLTTTRGETPLHFAARSGQVSVAAVLVDAGASVAVTTKDGHTALHVAARTGDADLVELLLSHGADVDAVTSDQYTALHIAAKEGHDDIAKVLLDQGHANYRLQTKKGYTALHLCAKYGSADTARLLLDGGADVESTSQNGLTPLHIATHYGRLAVTRLLLERGASPHSTALNGYTALHIAARKNDIDIGRLLFDHKANSRALSKNGFAPVHIAAEEGYAQMVGILLRNGALVNCQSNNGLFPLHLAAQEDQLPVAEVLVDVGCAVIDVHTKAGYTPLHTACHFGSIQVAQYLLEKGASVNRVTKAGHTALHQAALQGHQVVVDRLLRHGAKPDCFTNAGQTPLSLAEAGGYEAVVDILRRVTQVTPRAAPEPPPEDQSTLTAEPPETMVDSVTFDSDDETEHHLSSRRGEDKTLNTSIADSSAASADVSLGRVRRPSDRELFSFDRQRSEHLSETGSIGGPDTSAARGLFDVDDVLLPPPSSLFPGFSDIVSRLDDSYWLLTQDEEEVLQCETPAGLYEATPPPSGMGLTPLTASTPLRWSAPDVAGSRSMNGSWYNTMQSIGSYSQDSFGRLSRQSRNPIYTGFLVSFIVDARGGAMCGLRHSGVRIIVPPGRADEPTRITCKLVRIDKVEAPPPLEEDEALASRVLKMGPIGAKFSGPVVIEVPHFAALRDGQREITVLRSDDGSSWRRHSDLTTGDAVQNTLSASFEGEGLESAEDLYHRRITRIQANEFPTYFAVVTRVTRNSEVITPSGGVVGSTVDRNVEAIVPQGAFKKNVKLSLQVQSVPDEAAAKVFGNQVSVGPVVTIEPRRRKFHRPVKVTLPLPPSLSDAAGAAALPGPRRPLPTNLRLLCSLSEGSAPTEWQDITDSVPLQLDDNTAAFNTTVSGRYWLVDVGRSPNVDPDTRLKMAAELYRDVIAVPFMSKFVVFAKRRDETHGTLRVFCITDDKVDKTLESQERYTEVARSDDVEVVDNKPLYLEMSGNLIPISKTEDQLNVVFRAFVENRLAFPVRVRQLNREPTARLSLMRDPREKRDQTPACTLNVTLPDYVPRGDNSALEADIRPDVTSRLDHAKRQLDSLLSDDELISPRHDSNDDIKLVRESKEENKTADDGTKIKRVIYMIKHYRVVRTFTDSFEEIIPAPKELLLGMEVIEEITEEAPGTSDLPSAEVEVKTTESQTRETLPDGTWVTRTIRRTSLQPLSRQESPADAPVKEAVSELPVNVNKATDVSSVPASKGPLRTDEELARQSKFALPEVDVDRLKAAEAVKSNEPAKAPASNGIVDEPLSNKVSESVTPTVAPVVEKEIELASSDLPNAPAGSRKEIVEELNVALTADKAEEPNRKDEEPVSQPLDDEEDDLIKDNNEENEVKPDGTQVKKLTFTLTHVKRLRHTSDVVTTEQRITPKHERVVGIEVFEEITEIAPGTQNLHASQIETTKSEQKFEETLPDGTWKERTVLLTVIQPRRPGAADDVPDVVSDATVKDASVDSKTANAENDVNVGIEKSDTKDSTKPAAKSVVDGSSNPPEKSSPIADFEVVVAEGDVAVLASESKSDSVPVGPVNNEQLANSTVTTDDDFEIVDIPADNEYSVDQDELPVANAEPTSKKDARSAEAADTARHPDYSAEVVADPRPLDESTSAEFQIINKSSFLEARPDTQSEIIDKTTDGKIPAQDSVLSEQSSKLDEKVVTGYLPEDQKPDSEITQSTDVSSDGVKLTEPEADLVSSKSPIDSQTSFVIVDKSTTVSSIVSVEVTPGKQALKDAEDSNEQDKHDSENDASERLPDSVAIIESDIEIASKLEIEPKAAETGQEIQAEVPAKTSAAELGTKVNNQVSSAEIEPKNREQNANETSRRDINLRGDAKSDDSSAKTSEFAKLKSDDQQQQISTHVVCDLDNITPEKNSALNDDAASIDRPLHDVEVICKPSVKDEPNAALEASDAVAVVPVATTSIDKAASIEGILDVQAKIQAPNEAAAEPVAVDTGLKRSPEDENEDLDESVYHDKPAVISLPSDEQTKPLSGVRLDIEMKHPTDDDSSPEANKINVNDETKFETSEVDHDGENLHDVGADSENTLPDAKDKVGTEADTAAVSGVTTVVTEKVIEINLVGKVPAKVPEATDAKEVGTAEINLRISPEVKPETAEVITADADAKRETLKAASSPSDDQPEIQPREKRDVLDIQPAGDDVIPVSAVDNITDDLAGPESAKPTKDDSKSRDAGPDAEDGLTTLDAQSDPESELKHSSAVAVVVTTSTEKVVSVEEISAVNRIDPAHAPKDETEPATADATDLQLKSDDGKPEASERTEAASYEQPEIRSGEQLGREAELPVCPETSPETNQINVTEAATDLKLSGVAGDRDDLHDADAGSDDALPSARDKADANAESSDVIASLDIVTVSAEKIESDEPNAGHRDSKGTAKEDIDAIRNEVAQKVDAGSDDALPSARDKAAANAESSDVIASLDIVTVSAEKIESDEPNAGDLPSKGTEKEDTDAIRNEVAQKTEPTKPEVDKDETKRSIEVVCDVVSDDCSAQVDKLRDPSSSEKQPSEIKPSPFDKTELQQHDEPVTVHYNSLTLLSDMGKLQPHQPEPSGSQPADERSTDSVRVPSELSQEATAKQVVLAPGTDGFDKSNDLDDIPVPPTENSGELDSVKDTETGLLTLPVDRHKSDADSDIDDAFLLNASVLLDQAAAAADNGRQADAQLATNEVVSDEIADAKRTDDEVKLPVEPEVGAEKVAERREPAETTADSVSHTDNGKESTSSPALQQEKQEIAKGDKNQDDETKVDVSESDKSTLPNGAHSQSDSHDKQDDVFTDSALSETELKFSVLETDEQEIADFQKVVDDNASFLSSIGTSSVTSVEFDEIADNVPISCSETPVFEKEFQLVPEPKADSKKVDPLVANLKSPDQPETVGKPEVDFKAEIPDVATVSNDEVKSAEKDLPAEVIRSVTDVEKHHSLIIGLEKVEVSADKVTVSNEVARDVTPEDNSTKVRQPDVPSSENQLATETVLPVSVKDKTLPDRANVSEHENATKPESGVETPNATDKPAAQVETSANVSVDAAAISTDEPNAVLEVTDELNAEASVSIDLAEGALHVYGIDPGRPLNTESNEAEIDRGDDNTSEADFAPTRAENNKPSTEQASEIQHPASGDVKTPHQSEPVAVYYESLALLSDLGALQVNRQPADEATADRFVAPIDLRHESPSEPVAPSPTSDAVIDKISDRTETKRESTVEPNENVLDEDRSDDLEQPVVLTLHAGEDKKVFITEVVSINSRDNLQPALDESAAPADVGEHQGEVDSDIEDAFLLNASLLDQTAADGEVASADILAKYEVEWPSVEPEIAAETIAEDQPTSKTTIEAVQPDVPPKSASADTLPDEKPTDSAATGGILPEKAVALKDSPQKDFPPEEISTTGSTVFQDDVSARRSSVPDGEVPVTSPVFDREKHTGDPSTIEASATVAIGNDDAIEKLPAVETLDAASQIVVKQSDEEQPAGVAETHADRSNIEIIRSDLFSIEASNDEVNVKDVSEYIFEGGDDGLLELKPKEERGLVAPELVDSTIDALRDELEFTEAAAEADLFVDGQPESLASPSDTVEEHFVQETVAHVEYFIGTRDLADVLGPEEEQLADPQVVQGDLDAAEKSLTLSYVTSSELSAENDGAIDFLGELIDAAAEQGVPVTTPVIDLDLALAKAAALNVKDGISDETTASDEPGLANTGRLSTTDDAAASTKTEAISDVNAGLLSVEASNDEVSLDDAKENVEIGDDTLLALKPKEEGSLVAPEQLQSTIDALCDDLCLEPLDVSADGNLILDEQSECVTSPIDEACETRFVPETVTNVEYFIGTRDLEDVIGPDEENLTDTVVASSELDKAERLHVLSYVDPSELPTESDTLEENIEAALEQNIQVTAGDTTTFDSAAETVLQVNGDVSDETAPSDLARIDVKFTTDDKTVSIKALQPDDSSDLSDVRGSPGEPQLVQEATLNVEHPEDGTVLESITGPDENQASGVRESPVALDKAESSVVINNVLPSQLPVADESSDEALIATLSVESDEVRKISILAVKEGDNTDKTSDSEPSVKQVVKELEPTVDASRPEIHEQDADELSLELPSEERVSIDAEAELDILPPLVTKSEPLAENDGGIRRPGLVKQGTMEVHQPEMYVNDEVEQIDDMQDVDFEQVQVTAALDLDMAMNFFPKKSNKNRKSKDGDVSEADKTEQQSPTDDTDKLNEPSSKAQPTDDETKSSVAAAAAAELDTVDVLQTELILEDVSVAELPAPHPVEIAPKAELEITQPAENVEQQKKRKALLKQGTMEAGDMEISLPDVHAHPDSETPEQHLTIISEELHASIDLPLEPTVAAATDNDTPSNVELELQQELIDDVTLNVEISDLKSDEVEKLQQISTETVTGEIVIKDKDVDIDDADDESSKTAAANDGVDLADEEEPLAEQLDKKKKSKHLLRRGTMEASELEVSVKDIEAHLDDDELDEQQLSAVAEEKEECIVDMPQDESSNKVKKSKHLLRRGTMEASELEVSVKDIEAHLDDDELDVEQQLSVLAEEKEECIDMPQDESSNTAAKGKKSKHLLRRGTMEASELEVSVKDIEAHLDDDELDEQQLSAVAEEKEECTVDMPQDESSNKVKKPKHLLRRGTMEASELEVSVKDIEAQLDDDELDVEQQLSVLAEEKEECIDMPQDESLNTAAKVKKSKHLLRRGTMEASELEVSVKDIEAHLDDDDELDEQQLSVLAEEKEECIDMPPQSCTEALRDEITETDEEVHIDELQAEKSETAALKIEQEIILAPQPSDKQKSKGGKPRSLVKQGTMEASEHELSLQDVEAQLDDEVLEQQLAIVLEEKDEFLDAPLKSATPVVTDDETPAPVEPEMQVELLDSDEERDDELPEASPPKSESAEVDVLASCLPDDTVVLQPRRDDFVSTVLEAPEIRVIPPDDEDIQDVDGLETQVSTVDDEDNSAVSDLLDEALDQIDIDEGLDQPPAENRSDEQIPEEVRTFAGILVQSALEKTLDQFALESREIEQAQEVVETLPEPEVVSETEAAAALVETVLASSLDQVIRESELASIQTDKIDDVSLVTLSITEPTDEVARLAAYEDVKEKLQAEEDEEDEGQRSLSRRPTLDVNSTDDSSVSMEASSLELSVQQTDIELADLNPEEKTKAAPEIEEQVLPDSSVEAGCAELCVGEAGDDVQLQPVDEELMTSDTAAALLDLELQIISEQTTDTAAESPESEIAPVEECVVRYAYFDGTRDLNDVLEQQEERAEVTDVMSTDVTTGELESSRIPTEALLDELVTKCDDWSELLDDDEEKPEVNVTIASGAGDERNEISIGETESRASEIAVIDLLQDLATELEPEQSEEAASGSVVTDETIARPETTRKPLSRSLPKQLTMETCDDEVTVTVDDSYLEELPESDEVQARLAEPHEVVIDLPAQPLEAELVHDATKLNENDRQEEAILPDTDVVETTVTVIGLVQESVDNFVVIKPKEESSADSESAEKPADDEAKIEKQTEIPVQKVSSKRALPTQMTIETHDDEITFEIPCEQVELADVSEIDQLALPDIRAAVQQPRESTVDTSFLELKFDVTDAELSELPFEVEQPLSATLVESEKMIMHEPVFNVEVRASAIESSSTELRVDATGELEPETLELSDVDRSAADDMVYPEAVDVQCPPEVKEASVSDDVTVDDEEATAQTSPPNEETAVIGFPTDVQVDDLELMLPREGAIGSEAEAETHTPIVADENSVWGTVENVEDRLPETTPADDTATVGIVTETVDDGVKIGRPVVQNVDEDDEIIQPVVTTVNQSKTKLILSKQVTIETANDELTIDNQDFTPDESHLINDAPSQETTSIESEEIAVPTLPSKKRMPKQYTMETHDDELSFKISDVLEEESEIPDDSQAAISTSELFQPSIEKPLDQQLPAVEKEDRVLQVESSEITEDDSKESDDVLRQPLPTDELLTRPAATDAVGSETEQEAADEFVDEADQSVAFGETERTVEQKIETIEIDVTSTVIEGHAAADEENAATPQEVSPSEILTTDHVTETGNSTVSRETVQEIAIDDAVSGSETILAERQVEVHQIPDSDVDQRPVGAPEQGADTVEVSINAGITELDTEDALTDEAASLSVTAVVPDAEDLECPVNVEDLAAAGKTVEVPNVERRESFAVGSKTVGQFEPDAAELDGQEGHVVSPEEVGASGEEIPARHDGQDEDGTQLDRTVETTSEVVSGLQVETTEAGDATARVDPATVSGDDVSPDFSDDTETGRISIDTTEVTVVTTVDVVDRKTETVTESESTDVTEVGTRTERTESDVNDVIGLIDDASRSLITEQNRKPETEDELSEEWCVVDRQKEAAGDDKPGERKPASDDEPTMYEDGSIETKTFYTKTTITESSRTKKTRTQMVRRIDDDGEITESQVLVEYEDSDSDDYVIEGQDSRRSSFSEREDFDVVVSTKGRLEGGEDAAGGSITVFTSTIEDEPDVEMEMNETEDTLPDGTVVKRKVTTTHRRQTVTRRVVLEGLDEEDDSLGPLSPLPPGITGSTTTPPSTTDVLGVVIPSGRQSDDSGIDARRHLMRYSDRSCTEPELSTEVQLGDERLPDGTQVKRRTTTKRSQQLITERLVIAGDRLLDVGSGDDEDEVFDSLKRIGSPGLASPSAPAAGSASKTS